MSDKGTGNFFTGLMIGAVVGLAIGFLFAPRSGEESRQLLKEKVGKAKEKAAEVAENIKKASSDIKDKFQTS